MSRRIASDVSSIWWVAFVVEDSTSLSFCVAAFSIWSSFDAFLEICSVFLSIAVRSSLI